MSTSESNSGAERPRPRYIDILEEEFGRALGAPPTASQEKLTLFISHSDRENELVPDWPHWVRQAERVLSAIGGGATSFEARGAWMEKSKQFHEATTLVYTYAPAKKIEEAVGAIRTFIYDFGRSTRQYEVGVLLQNTDGDWFYRIPSEAYNDPKS